MSRVVVFGSINVDLVAEVARLPGPGETIKTDSYVALPGGKGANQALAAARNGAAIHMVGAVGSDGQAPTALAQLRSDGVGLAAVAEVEGASGLAMIAVDAGGECIVSTPSSFSLSAAAAQLPPMEPGDWLVTQNEVDWTQTARAHRLAREQGAGVIHNTAPAHGLSAAELARIDVLVANEHELAQAAASAAETGAEAQARSLLASGVGAVVLTLGA